MSKIIKTYNLENQITAKITDETERYFGEYFNVILRLLAPIKIEKNFFNDENIFIEAKYLLGDSITYSRIIEKKAVYEKDLEIVKESVIKDFEINSLAYLSRKSFVVKFIQKKVKDEKRKQEIEKLRRELREGKDTSSF